MENKIKNISKVEPTKIRTKLTTVVSCLFVTLVFWIFNALSHDNTTIINYPIHLEVDNKNFISKESNKKKIKVEVSGYGWTLLRRSFGVGNVPIVLYPKNLINNKLSVQTVVMPMLKDKINDIKIIQVLDDTLLFYIAKRKVKKVFLKLDTKKISLPSKSIIDGKVNISPNFIVCSGIENNINLIPDSIYFSIPDEYIENKYSNNVEIKYRPFSDISLEYNTVKVDFLISKQND